MDICGYMKLHDGFKYYMPVIESREKWKIRLSIQDVTYHVKEVRYHPVGIGMWIKNSEQMSKGYLEKSLWYGICVYWKMIRLRKREEYANCLIFCLRNQEVLN